MRREEYRSLFESLTSREAAVDLARTTGVSYNTLLCIYAQKYQEHTKKTLHYHRLPHRMAKYYQRYLQGEDLVSIAEEVNIAPCLLARLVLQCHIGLQHQQPQSEVFLKNEVARYMKKPETISDPSLRAQVYQCIDCDDSYSPLVEKIRRAAGLEYEYLLQERLHNMRIAFVGEEQLRAQGFPKTPDIKLLLPFAIQLKDYYLSSSRSSSSENTQNNIEQGGFVEEQEQQGGRRGKEHKQDQEEQGEQEEEDESWFSVNWIESKASFGDDISHSANMQQLWGYRTRYGPGIVVYWFGFIDELRDHWRRKGILILDRFPPPGAVLQPLQYTLPTPHPSF